MSDPMMPAGLAALLSEPGWDRLRYGAAWRYDIAPEPYYMSDVFVLVECIVSVWSVHLVAETLEDEPAPGLTTEQVGRAYELMRSVEAALAQEGTK